MSLRLGEDGAFTAEIIVVVCNVIFGICDIDYRLALMMVVYLFIVVDNLTSFLRISGDVGNSDWPPARRAYASESNSIFK